MLLFLVMFQLSAIAIQLSYQMNSSRNALKNGVGILNQKKPSNQLRISLEFLKNVVLNMIKSIMEHSKKHSTSLIKTDLATLIEKKLLRFVQNLMLLLKNMNLKKLSRILIPTKTESLIWMSSETGTSAE